jgi:hypothetical protein
VGARFARWQRAVALWCGADPARGDPAMNRLGEMISGGTVVAPLVFNPISAKLAEAAGFRAGNATFTIIFHYTYDGCTANYFESATCALQIQNGNLPTVSSSCRGTANGSPFQEVNDAVLEPCEVTAIPGGGGGRCTGGFSHRTGVSAPPGRVAR